MKTETPITNAVVQPLRNPELSYRERIIWQHACELERLAATLNKALVNLNNDASTEIAEYQVPSDVREVLDEYERMAAMPNESKLSHGGGES
jgi:hypothetical protein